MLASQSESLSLTEISIDSIFDTLKLNSNFFRTLPRFKKVNYQATIKFLNDYKTQSKEQSQKQVKDCLETLYHLGQIPEWELIDSVLINILKLPIYLNPAVTNLSLPVAEYLLFQGSYQTLINTTKELINTLKNSTHINHVLLLKARALAGLNQEPTQIFQILKTIAINSHPESLQHLEANCHLAMYQVGLGHYQEGIISLQNLLTIINHKLQNKFLSDYQIIYELKTEILEILAYYEMNRSNFTKASQIYDEVITLRQELGLIHKMINPQVHQGIILRRNSQYEQGIKILTNAQEQAKLINNLDAQTFIAHHLAYIYLNQGNVTQAKPLAKIAFEGYQKLDNFRGISDCYEQLGLINLAENNFDEAQQNFQIALTMRQSISNLHGAASCLLDLALAYWHQKRIIKSIIFLFKGFYAYAKLGILNKVRLRRMLKLAYTWTFGKRDWTM
jgi:tetratricopeptide (TPR) repeat protein